MPLTNLLTTSQQCACKHSIWTQLILLIFVYNRELEMKVYTNVCAYISTFNSTDVSCSLFAGNISVHGAVTDQMPKTQGHYEYLGHYWQLAKNCLYNSMLHIYMSQTDVDTVDLLYVSITFLISLTF